MAITLKKEVVIVTKSLLMRTLLVLFLATAVSGLSFAADIGDARKEGRYINIYDSALKKIATVNPAGGVNIELHGVTPGFIVVSGKTCDAKYLIGESCYENKRLRSD